MNNIGSFSLSPRALFSTFRLGAFACLMLTPTLFSRAEQRAWTGLGADSLWSTAGNWDSGVPAGADTALFSGAGNGKTAVTFGGTVTNAGLWFSADAAPYTIGASGETLALSANGTLILAANAASDQTVAANTVLSGNATLSNNTPTCTLTLSGPLTTTAGAKTLTINGSGPVVLNTVTRYNTDDLNIQTRLNAPLTFSGALNASYIWLYDYPAHVTLAPASINVLRRGDWALVFERTGSVNGDAATTLSFQHTTSTSQGRVAVQNGTIGTVNVRLTGPQGLYMGGHSGGTLVLPNLGNDFTGPVNVEASNNTLSVPTIGAKNIACPLGAGTNIVLNGTPARLLVTGSADTTTDRDLVISNASILENSGTGLLTFTAPATGNGALTLTGSGNGALGGVRSGTGSLTKTGSGTWTLAAANTYSGATAVNNGTLAVVSGGKLGTGVLTFANNANLSLNPTAAPDFSLTLPATLVNGAGRLTIAAPASGTSTVTIPTLTATNATLSVIAPDTGASNRLFINNLAEGPVVWITLNGAPAAYSAANGLIPFAPASTAHIPTLGPGATIPDAPDGAAVIDAQGTSGPVTLALPLTSVTLLSQEYPTDALIDFGGGMLAANMLRQTPGAGGLTLRNGTLTANGANPNAGVPGIGTLSLATLTDDASTGISTAKTYTHTLDFGNQTPVASINGVAFTKVSSAAGTVGSYGWSGFPTSLHNNWNDFTNNIPPDTGAGLRALLFDMLYGGVNYTVKLTGLTPGAAYEFRLYVRTWDGRASTVERTARFDFLTDAAGAPIATAVFDMNHQDPTALVFRYVAATSELTLKTFCTADTPNPYPGFFGITNEKLAEAPGSLKTGNAALVFNAAGTAPLTVAAAVADNGRTTTLIKESGGTLTLAGAVSHTGATALNGGTLDLAPTNGVSQVFSAPVVGSGAVTKRDDGSTLFLAANTYDGPTVVSNGILSIGHSDALGLTTAGTTVEPGGALALGPAELNKIVVSEPITLSGAGPDSLGALRNDSAAPQLYAFKNVALSGPATVGGTAPLSGFPLAAAPSSSGRFDIRNGVLNFGGHTLTKAGPNAFIITSSAITGVTADVSIDIEGGVFGVESTTHLQGAETNTLKVGEGASFDLYQLSNPLRWSLLVQEQGHLTARNNTATNHNLLTGPINLAGTAILDGAYHDTLAGVLSGQGGLLKAIGFTHLTGTNNSYEGTTTITNGSLLAMTARSLPAADFSRVSVTGNGTLAVRFAGTSDGQAGWSEAEVANLVASGAFTTRSTSLGFESMYAGATYADTLPLAGIAKFGPYPLTLESDTYELGPVTVYEGLLDLTPADHDLGTNSVKVGADPLNVSLAALRLGGTASLLTTDPGYNRSGPLVAAGTANASRGILYLDDDAAVSGRLYLGSGGNNAEGAVYQTGGTFLNTGGTANDGQLGISGHGYYEISGGSLTNKGYTQLGVNAGNSGILRQTGGSVVFNSGTVPASGAIGNYYGGTFAVRAGLGLFHLCGGTFTTGTSRLSLGEWSSVNNYSDCTGILTLEGDADASANTLELANRNGTATSVVNLNGGSFATRYLLKGGNNNSSGSRAYINFNGGNLRITESGSPVRTAANNSATVLAVRDGGASLEIDAGVNATLDLPLGPPAGQGVTFIGVNSRGAGYIAPPFVNITGGGGYGATAVATINRETGQLADIRVTSPGTGYTSAPSVSLLGGGYTAAGSVIDVAIGLNSSTGGLTKLGTGSLVLGTNNTFRGAVTVSGGILAARTPAAIPQGADLVLNGGLLDLGGRALTNSSVTLSSGGGLLNGSVLTATLLKNGAGSADLTAGISLAPTPVSAKYGTPGLYEGRLINRTNRIDPNPRTSVQPTTRAVNGANVVSGGTINSCRWPDNTCYVYTGYLWNRAATNVVWTFGENFDDNVYLVIDGKAILDNDAATTPTYRNVLLTPGPHAFEVRCGQSSGNVGANWVRSDSYRVGFGVDYLGRAQNLANNYEPLVDPGDGSLFTLDLPASYTQAEVVPAADIPELPTELAANVGALADGYALVYGSDVPTTGGSINATNSTTRYFADHSLTDTNDFDRVAYYLELNHPTTGNQWVWVSFDAVTRDRSLIGYPFHDERAGAGFCANVFQRKVDNMDVRSNVPGITNYLACATGNIEFWPNNYGQGDALGLGASSTTSNNSGFDFGDTKSDGVPSARGHGSFQIHNWGDKTTLFAMNNWGTGNNTLALGIGNQPGSGTSIAPDWTFNYNAAGYTYRRLYVLTRDIVRAPKAATATVAEGTLRLPTAGFNLPVPDAIRAKVGSAANDYDVLYASAVPVTAATIVGGTAYSIDYSNDTTPFDRVAYYMELEHPTYGNQWVWVSFDAHTANRKQLGYPSQTGNLFMWQRKVTNMDVRSNVSGVNAYTGSDTGNLEIWPSNYGMGVSGLGLGGSGSAFDFDDSGGTTNVGHGCFQIHNWGDKVTLLAVSHLGSSGSTLGIGIGNNPTPSANPSEYDPDYTFTYNAAQYTMKNLYVFIRPTLRSLGDTLASVDLSVAAGAVLDLGGSTQAIHSVTGAGTVSNGVLAANTVLSPAGDGAVGTLFLSGVGFAHGVRYRADLGDLLNVTGALNVSGMVLTINNPAALNRSQTYTLIQTTGGVTGAATLDTELPSGWKLVLRDNALLLISEGGTLFMFR